MNTNSKNNIPSQDRENTQLFNNTLSIGSQEVTIISTELVELINKIRSTEKQIRHSDFLIKVPKVLKGGERNFSSSYFNSQNKEQPCYRFPKREASLMAMSYSYEVQAAVFDHMTKLEEQSKQSEIIVTQPKTALEIIKFATAELEKVTKELAIANTTIDIQKPKVEYYDQVNSSEGLITIKQTAEILKIGQNALFATLRGWGYLFDKGDNYNVPKAEFIKEREYFELKEAYYNKPIKDFFGQEKTVKVLYSKVYVTKKGFNHLYKKLRGDDSNELF